MRPLHVLRFALVLVAVSCAAAAHAQLPHDNEAWKERCKLLQANDSAILRGHAPAMLTQATRGIAGLQYMTLGFDRRRAGEHNVACTMFYMAAIAESAGSGGKPDPGKAQTYAEVALAEFQQTHGQKVPISERIKRFDAEMGQVKAPSLTPEQVEALLGAASTMPVSLAPPPR